MLVIQHLSMRVVPRIIRIIRPGIQVKYSGAFVVLQKELLLAVPVGTHKIPGINKNEEEDYEQHLQRRNLRPY